MITKADVDSLGCYSKKMALMSRVLTNFVKSKVYNHSDAQDVVQNTLLILSQKRNLFDPNKSFYNWAFKICQFQIKKYLTQYKRNIKRSFGGINELFCQEPDSPLDKIISGEILSNKLNSIELLKIKLPLRQSQVFNHIINGTSRAESRRILGMKENNFNRTYFGTIKSCKKILSKSKNETQVK